MTTLPAYHPGNDWGLPQAIADQLRTWLAALAPPLREQSGPLSAYSDAPNTPAPTLRCELLAPEPFTPDLQQRQPTAPRKPHTKLTSAPTIQAGVLETLRTADRPLTAAQIAQQLGCVTDNVTWALVPLRRLGLVHKHAAEWPPVYTYSNL